jgi:protein-serine/threonine kinase
LGKIGKGSFGHVYLVRCIHDGQEYAMKVLKKTEIIGRNLVRYAFTEKNILMDFDC